MNGTAFKHGARRRASVRRGALVALAIAAIAVVSGCGASGSAGGGSDDRRSLVQEVQSRGELRVGVAAATPDLYKDPKSGEWKGVYVDLMQAWADTLGVKLKPVETSWDQMIAALQAHRIDVAPDVDATAQRATSVQFSDGVRSTTGMFALAPKSTARSWEQLDDPATTICIAKGTTTGEALKASKPRAKLLELANQNACLAAVTAGRAEALFDTVVTATGFAAATAGVRTLFPPRAILNNPAALAIALGHPYSDVAALNVQIRQWKADPGGYAASLARNNAVVTPLRYVLEPVPAWAQQMVEQDFPRS